MDDDLRSYLAGQSATIAASDEAPQSEDDPNPTDQFDDEAMLDGDDSPGADDDLAEDDDLDDEAADEPVAAAEPDPRLIEIERKASEAERKAQELQNQIAVEREYNRLMARWSQMDPEDAEAEKRALLQDLANQQTQQLRQENLTLRQQVERERDLKEHKPRAIHFLAEKHGLNAAERAQLERVDDPMVMTIMAEGFAGARKVAEREERRRRRDQRLNGNQDRIGTKGLGGAPASPTNAPTSLAEYLQQQKAGLMRP